MKTNFPNSGFANSMLRSSAGYALVPRQSLEATLEAQATTLAREQMEAINHTLALEAQAASPKEREELTRILIEALLAGSVRTLWKSDVRDR